LSDAPHDRRLRAEREAERIYALSPALLAVAGFDGYLRRFNPAFAVFGYSDEELRSRPWIEFAHPDDRPRVAQAAQALERGEAIVSLENRVVCRDGSVRWIEWSTRVVPEEGVFYAAGRDVTEARRAAEEQAALRRVATLVAQETAPAALLSAVSREVGEVLGVDATHLGRYEADGTVVSVAEWGRYPSVEVGTRFPLDGDSVSARVRQTGRPARMDDYRDADGAIAATLRKVGIHHAIGAPISVAGRIWGVMTATAKDAPLPPGAEARLERFAELIGTAISNAEARREVARLAEEQAALRRVATLVAQGAAADAVFGAVIAEVANLLDASAVTLARYVDEEELVVVARRGLALVGHGERFPLGGTNVTSTVVRTGKPARLDDFAGATGTIGDYARGAGVRSVVAAPVTVEGGIWGVLATIWTGTAVAPEDTEDRLARFAELLHTAIANADNRDQLTASRARVLAAGDEARRRLVRDLHDGAQQRLVHTIMTLKLARRAFREGRGDAEALVEQSLSSAERAIEDLRELSHGILPAALTQHGLRSGIDAFVARMELPVAVDVCRERLPTDIEASAYFIVAEALTNVVKHAGASRATVRVGLDAGVLTVEVGDDGVGGADPTGHGLMGVADRVDALGGTLEIRSPAGQGMTLRVELPSRTGSSTTLP
jgi:PAS domain S-box-containing protein